MRKYLKSSIAFLLVVIMLVTSYLPTFAVGEPTTYSKTSNSGERDEICTTLDGTSAGSYYSGSYTYANLTAQTTEQLFSSLRTLMRSTHKKISDYDDCHYEADKTDCENNDGKVSLIYTGYSATMSQYNGWNREHVWPKSLGGNNTSGGGADLHHIRPSDASVNSSRGNDQYGNVSGGSSVYGKNPASGYLGGTRGNGYFEPNDNVKGDVARICLYVYVRWGSDWGADSITEVFQSVDVLLEWMELDPVDTWEMGRNEVVQNFQGNRNVFIDYPELAWLIFGREVPANMTTPSGGTGSGSTGGGSTGGNQGGGTTDPDQGGNGGNQGGTTTPTDPAEILDAAYALGVGESMTGPFTLTGVITSLDQHNNPTMVVGDHTDKPIYCYYLVDDRFVVGATITVTAENIQNYDGLVEMTYCTLNSITLPDGGNQGGGSTGGNQGGTTDPDQGGSGGNQGGTTPPPPCTHTSTELKNVKAATCKADGYSGDTYCKDCGVLLSSGQDTKFNGDHSFGSWELSSDGETHSRHCTVCGTEEIMTIEILLSSIDSDAEKILILLTLGITDVELLDALSK